MNQNNEVVAESFCIGQGLIRPSETLSCNLQACETVFNYRYITGAYETVSEMICFLHSHTLTKEKIMHGFQAARFLLLALSCTYSKRGLSFGNLCEGVRQNFVMICKTRPDMDPSKFLVGGMSPLKFQGGRKLDKK